MPAQDTTVAVIGLGAAGLTALKNLTEEGFRVTGFDRNSYVGGLWKYTEDDKTSVLQSTIVNGSKERGCFTDFPYPEHTSSYPTGAEVCDYLVNYLVHFKLEPYARLNTAVRQITFDDEHQKWAVGIEGEGESVEFFDKLVVAIGGINGIPTYPAIEGEDVFKGKIIHSRAFKRPGDFAGKRVMVVGFGNTAVDTATQLAGVAGKVYLAHRHGALVIPRWIKGKPVDHGYSLRSFITQNVILEYFPTLGGNVVDWLVKGFQDSCFKLRPEWGFEPAQNTPIISDTLVDCLERGSIQSTGGIRRILGDTQVELEDGRTFDIDVLIWCTGYRSDFSMLEPCFDPTTHSTASWLGAGGSNGKPLARLYRNVFSLKKPDSLAFLGNVHFALSGFQIFDMASMAIAQVWKGASALPSLTVMEKAVDADHAWMGEVAKGTSNVSPGMVDGGKWLHAMDDLAGTGVNENLGYGWAGWVFWLNNRRLSNMLMGGLWSPHMHRLFDGKRRRWDGALKEVERVNGVATAAKSKDV